MDENKNLETTSTQLPEKPSSYLILAIISMLFCQPMGIAAIIFASQVDSAYNSGRYQDAVKNSKRARLFSLIGLITSVLFIVLYVLFLVVVLIAGAAN